MNIESFIKKLQGIKEMNQNTIQKYFDDLAKILFNHIIAADHPGIRAERCEADRNTGESRVNKPFVRVCHAVKHQSACSRDSSSQDNHFRRRKVCDKSQCFSEHGAGSADHELCDLISVMRRIKNSLNCHRRRYDTDRKRQILFRSAA